MQTQGTPLKVVEPPHPLPGLSSPEELSEASLQTQMWETKRRQPPPSPLGAVKMVDGICPATHPCGPGLQTRTSPCPRCPVVS